MSTTRKCKTAKQDKLNQKDSLLADAKEQYDRSIRTTAYTNGIISAALSIDQIHNNNLDLKSLLETLRGRIINAQKGDFVRQEEILASQIEVLDNLFHYAVVKSFNSKTIDEFHVFSDLAFRSTAQCRKTILVLNELKNPKRVNFIKQQNNAINQQINSSEKYLNSNENGENKLLKEIHREKLDSRGKSSTITDNKELAALDKIHRTKEY